MVAPVVRGKRVIFSVQAEFGARDSIRVTAGDVPVKRVAFQVRFQIIKTNNYISNISILVGNINLSDDGSEGHHSYGYPSRVAQGESLNDLFVARFSKNRFLKTH